MSISSIQSSDSAYSVLFNERNRGRAEESAGPTGAGAGTDTVSISPEARQLAAMAGEEEDAEAYRKELERREAAAMKQPASLKGLNLFGMMMESLFLAELEESRNAPGATEDGAPESGGEKSGSANPLKDGEKVAELKKAINAFANGEADLSDLPKAMSVGASGGYSGMKSVADKQARAGGSPQQQDSDTKHG